MVYGMDRIGTRHASSTTATHVVAYLHRSSTNSQLKQAVFSIGREHQQTSCFRPTLSKRRGRSLVSSDQRQHLSDDCQRVASVSSDRRTPSPLVRRLYQPATREASSGTSRASPCSILSSAVSHYSSLEERLQSSSRASTISRLRVREHPAN